MSPRPATAPATAFEKVDEGLEEEATAAVTAAAEEEAAQSAKVQARSNSCAVSSASGAVAVGGGGKGTGSSSARCVSPDQRLLKRPGEAPSDYLVIKGYQPREVIRSHQRSSGETPSDYLVAMDDAEAPPPPEAENRSPPWEEKELATAFMASATLAQLEGRLEGLEGCPTAVRIDASRDALSCVARDERRAVEGTARVAEARAAEEAERAEYEELRQLDARSAAIHQSSLYRQQMHTVLKGAPSFVDAGASSSLDGGAGGGRADEAQRRQRRSSLPVYRGAGAPPAITPAGPSCSSVARPSEGKATARTATFAPSPSLVPTSGQRESGGTGGSRLLPPNSLRRPSPLAIHPSHIATPAPPPPVPAATAMAASEDAPVPEVHRWGFLSGPGGMPCARLWGLEA